MKRWRSQILDQEMLREQLLIELLSATGHAGELWCRIEQRICDCDLIASANLEGELRRMQDERLTTFYPDAKFGIWTLRPDGIVEAQRLRRELYEEYWKIRRCDSTLVEYFWRRQIIRKP